MSALAGVRQRGPWATLATNGPNARLMLHPLLTGLRRSDLRRWGQVADEVDLEPGDVLLQEDRIGDWFFLIEDGTATRTRAGVRLGELGAGDHVGEIAILGLGPQAATIAAGTAVRAFVVGRRQFLALSHDMPVIQQRLFPGLGEGGFEAKLRELRAAATADWKAVGAARAARAAANRPAPARLLARPGLPARRGIVNWPTLPDGLFVRRMPAVAAPPRRLPLAWRVALAVGVAGLVAVGGWVYHPPMLVVHPLRAVDISRDIAVTGAPVHPIHGRYLLLTVRLEQPTGFGALRAILAHDRRLPLRAVRGPSLPGAAPNAADVFRRSQREAAAAGARAAGLDVRVHGDGAIVVDTLDHGGVDGLLPGDVIVGVDNQPVATGPDVTRLAEDRPVGSPSTLTVERGGARVDVTLVRTPGEVASGQLRLVLTTRNATFSLPFEVTFRPREIGGPSGGLIYALALADMLGTRDIARGRTIAATGVIDPAGDVSPVGFVVEKSTAVRRARASQLLVPEDQVLDAARSGRPVHGVLTLGDAVRTLTAPE